MLLRMLALLMSGASIIALSVRATAAAADTAKPITAGGSLTPHAGIGTPAAPAANGSVVLQIPVHLKNIELPLVSADVKCYFTYVKSQTPGNTEANDTPVALAHGSYDGTVSVRLTLNYGTLPANIKGYGCDLVLAIGGGDGFNGNAWFTPGPNAPLSQGKPLSGTTFVNHVEGRFLGLTQGRENGGILST